MSQFDNQTLGVLQGRLVRYLMRSKEITLGRCTDDNKVDVDLSLEGPAFKVSISSAVTRPVESERFQYRLRLDVNFNTKIASTTLA